MAKDLLEGENVPSVSEVSNGKGMPENMRVAIHDAGPLTNPFTNVPYVVAIQFSAKFSGQEGQVDVCGLPGVQVDPNGLAGYRGERDIALLGPFAESADLAIAKVAIFDLEVTELRNPQPGIEHD